MPAPPRHFLMCMNMHWECQIICHDNVQLHSAEQDSEVLTMTPFLPLQTNEFRTFDLDKLTSINISSPGSPVTPVTPDFQQGHRHTLLVWGPNDYRVVSSWTPGADSLRDVLLETWSTWSFSGVTFTSMS